MTQSAGPGANTMGWKDPIVAEVRSARAALFADAGDDLEILCQKLREAEQRSDPRVVRRSPRPIDELPETVV